MRCTKSIDSGGVRSRRGIAAECWRFLDCDAGRTFPAVYAKSLCDVYDWQAEDTPNEHPPHRIWTFSGRTVQSDRTRWSKNWRAAAASPSPACGARRTSSAPAMRRSTANCRRCWHATKPDVLVMFGLAGAHPPRAHRNPRAQRHQPRRSGCGGAQAARWYDRTGRGADACAARPGAAAAQGGASDRREGRAVARRRPLPLQLSVLARDRGRRAPGRPEGRRLRACAEGARGTGSAPRAVNLRPAAARRRSRSCSRRSRRARTAR